MQSVAPLIACLLAFAIGCETSESEGTPSPPGVQVSTAGASAGSAASGGAGNGGQLASGGNAAAGQKPNESGGAGVAGENAGSGGQTAAGSGGAPAAGNGSGGSGNDGGAASSGRPVFVAVGYGALRVRSLDLGVTWVDEKTEGTSGDNEYLIRGVGFGNGLFVAARGFPGGKVRVSTDGASWTSHDAPTDQWMAAVAYAGSTYVATGSNLAWTSRDGVTWSSRSVFPSAARAMVVSSATLMVALSNGEWWRSVDAGGTWSLDSEGHTASNEVKIAHCGDLFQEVGDGNFQGLSSCSGFTRTRGAVHAEGTWLRAASGGIERSTDGATWVKVYSHSGVEDIEVGYVVP